MANATVHEQYHCCLFKNKIVSQEIKNRSSLKKDLSRPPKRDVQLFILVMIIFTIGMVMMLIYDVSAWWIWYIYLAIWTLIEFKIAKNIKLKWWWWVIIFAVILSIDWIVLEIVEYIKK